MTAWRMTALYDTGIVRQIDVELAVDSDDDDVIAAIERAARENGIRLERKSEPAPLPATSPTRAAGSRRKRTTGQR